MEQKSLNNDMELRNRFSVKESYETLKNMDSMLDNLRLSANTLAETYNLSSNSINQVKLIQPQDIDVLNITEISDLLESWGEDRDALTGAHMKSTDHSIGYLDFAKNVLKELREAGMTVETLELERLEVYKTVQDMEREQLDYYHSVGYKEKRELQLKKLREACEQDEDSPEKKEALRKLELLDNAKTLEFMFNRFNRFGEKEIKSIVDGFLDPSKGQYVYKKYANNIPKLGVTSDIMKRFYNIEELFLNDAYHPFNNLFIFVVIRFIAYMNVNDKKDVLYANSLLSKCESLFHHNFESVEGEDKFKYVIKSILNNFMSPEYTKLFKEKNTTYPLHPTRVEQDERERREFHDKCITVLKKELSDSMDSRYYTCDNEELCARLDEMYKEKIEMVEALNDGKEDSDKISVYTPYHQIKNMYDTFTEKDVVPDTEDEIADTINPNESVDIDSENLEGCETCEETKE